MTTHTKLDEILRKVEQFEKDAIARALEYAKIPAAGARAALANEKVLAQLRKIGVASLAEVEALTNRIARLEADIAALKAGQDPSGGSPLSGTSTNSPH